MLGSIIGTKDIKNAFDGFLFYVQIIFNKTIRGLPMELRNKSSFFLIFSLLIPAIVGCASTPFEGLSKAIADNITTADITKNNSQIESKNDLSTPKVAQSDSSQVVDNDHSKDGRIVKIHGFNVKVGGKRTNETRWNGTRPNQTILEKLFSEKPLQSISDYWPRVSITITDFSESLLFDSSTSKWSSLVDGVRPDECIKFDATVWFNAKSSKKLKNVVFCNSDINPSDLSPYTWKGMRSYSRLASPPISHSSGQARTTGPKIPRTLVPLDLGEDRLLWFNSEYLFANLLYVMRYRGPLNDLTDARVWFVQLSKSKF